MPGSGSAVLLANQIFPGPHSFTFNSSLAVPAPTPPPNTSEPAVIVDAGWEVDIQHSDNDCVELRTNYHASIIESLESLELFNRTLNEKIIEEGARIIEAGDSAEREDSICNNSDREPRRQPGGARLCAVKSKGAEHKI